MRITCVIGTRPEAIKISPVVHAARRFDPAVGITIVNSGQHQTEVASVLEELALDADEMLDDCAGLSLNRMTAALIASLGASTAVGDADLVLVQGDTTTAFAGGLAAFHRRIPVAHLEAGLRSGIPDRPFPEEAHRTLLATLADVHLAPTNQARRNLRAMGVDPGRIAVTGNTCVDVLMEYGARSSGEPPFASLLQGRRLILVTLHRRESWGEALGHVCDAIAGVVGSRDDAAVIFPLHPNPVVRALVAERLSRAANVHLVAPLPYPEFVRCLHAAHVVVTDSGGVQEEAATLGKQTLVVRQVTDRPEAMDAGVAQLVGTDPDAVARALGQALRTRPDGGVQAIYGDGRAAERVVTALTRWHGGLRPLLPPDLEFRSAASRYVAAAG